MELKDNFTNRYFKPDLVQKQVDMIKEPGATDALAEGFQRYGNLPANNAYAQLDNMTMAGVGDGMKATANDKRQEQLDPILKMTGQINAQNAYLEAQMQEQQEQTMQTQQFVKNQAFSFMQLSKAIAAGDTGAANNIARGILQSYKSSSGDAIIGDFDHYHDGNIYYTNAETGEKSALSIPLLLNQSEIAPELFGADYGNVMSSYSAGFKGQYENAQEMQRLALEKERAGIDQTRAHTGLYDAQAGKTTQEMTPEYQQQLRNQKGVDSRSNHNASEFIPKISEQYIKNNEIISSITEFKKILNNTSLTGGSGTAAVLRFIAEQTGNDENIVNAENAGQFYFEWMSDNSKGALSDRDMKNYMKTFASIDKNKNASINILNRLEGKLKNQNSIFTKQLEAYEQDPTTNLHSIDILSHKNEPNLQNDNFVVMTNTETGEPMEVPANKVELFKQNGYE